MKGLIMSIYPYLFVDTHSDVPPMIYTIGCVRVAAQVDPGITSFAWYASFTVAITIIPRTMLTPGVELEPTHPHPRHYKKR